MKKILLAILLLITQSCANNFTEALKNSKLSKSLKMMIIQLRLTN